MWLLIEKTIGAQLLMDVLESDPTPSQLTTALKQQLRATSVSPSQSVFLMVPAEGDSPSLAHFRALLKDRIHFVMIEYPGWREMIDAGAGFEAIVDAAVAQISRQSSQDVPCLLAGYSFGGLVAVETARRLVEHGRRIDFLALIDTRAERPPEETRQARSVSRPMKFIGKIFSALILISAFRPLKIMGQLATLLPAKQAFTIEYMLNTRLRTRSLRRLQLGTIRMPITLYRSNEGSSLDNGWSAHCSQVAVVPIGGDHHSILEPPFLDILCARFLETVEPFDLNINCDQKDIADVVAGMNSRD
jgi:thioesterase domain-containing protein